MVYMSKPIKLADPTYQRLKTMADLNRRTLGGQIDYLMDFIQEKWLETPPENLPPLPKTDPPEKLEPKITSGATPHVEDLLTRAPGYDPAVAERQNSGEQSCCQHPTRPCKHWVWDNQSGEGYKNVLSGRVREAE